MAIFRRILQSYDNKFLLKISPVTYKNNWNVEFASFVKKVDVPIPPKRPLTAYMIFCKEKRKEVLKENPSLTGTEQVKKLAEKWGYLSIDMKKPYEISARKSLLEYGEEHKIFYENLTEEQKECMSRLKAEKREVRRIQKLKKALRETGLPRSISSSYALFVQSQSKAKVDIKQPSEFIKEVAEKWRNLSDEAKKSFEAQALIDKKRYISELEQWRKKLISEGKTDLLREYDEMKGRGKIEVDDEIRRTLLKAKKVATTTDKTKTKKKIDVPKN